MDYDYDRIIYELRELYREWWETDIGIRLLEAIQIIEGVKANGQKA